MKRNLPIHKNWWLNSKLMSVSVALFLLSISFTTSAQNIRDYKRMAESEDMFTSIEEAQDSEYNVLHLSLRKNRLKQLPEEIRAFKDLEVLVLKNNKLDSLPDWLPELTQLKVLVLNKNYFTKFPEVLCQMKSLVVLQMGENIIEYVPPCINQLEQLEFLDLWSNQISNLPDEISDIKSLKVVDMRLTETNHDAQENIHELLPEVEVFLSTPCKCGD